MRRVSSANAVVIEDSSASTFGTRPGLPGTGPAYHRCVLTRLDLRGAGDDLRARLPRPDLGGAAPVEVVREILTDVRKRGDAALREYTERFDGVVVDELGVDQSDLDRALAGLPPLLHEALDSAQSAILAYHRHQLRAETEHTRDGLTVREVRRPVDRAGGYVP